MRKQLFVIILCLAGLLASHESNAQGCSDAGFCTMGAMKPDQYYSKKVNVKLRSVEINAYRGSTTLSPIIYVLTADMTFAITDRLFIQGKIPYQAVEGNLGKTSGLGDISLSLTQNLTTLKGGMLSATLGTKLPSNNSDLEKQDNEFLSKGSDFPMYYQVSLGSYDLIFGGSWINEKWMLATGVQIALTENQNDFRWGQWPGYPDGQADGEIDPYIEKYALANNLKRGIDVMFRVERNFRFTNFNFNIGLLPIYRITHDERLDFNTNERIKVEGTTGLALSALAGVGYSFDVKNSIKFIYGQKIMDREVNPDGLTRHVVTSLSYVYRF
ncbi:hypothetical protein N6H18_12970 [Reichenbachiella agarivorans]|uniref:Transporter n=1 Tax=Reichenbachiella agarivorans TaxID=2979464 RepID=A0ABY6CL63_9BACT|nr:hypothetical protein [Reichenbachiella agarivorans]UXP31261.1 hypothetical protein N6H18_12970 [Reichenbachiella agarivorans]